MSKTRDNHYVPQWYQKGFMPADGKQLCYLNLSPDKKELPDGRIITFNSLKHWPTSRCFYETDLYTTFFGNYVNDEVEKYLFGKIEVMSVNCCKSQFVYLKISQIHHLSSFSQ